jgi:hypothetical protein
MSIGMATTLRSARADEIVTAIGNACKVLIYTDTRPATGGSAAGATLLGTVTGASPFGSNSNGVITVSDMTEDSSADATGTATWARITTSADVFVMDLSVGTSGSDINLDSVSIVAGGTIDITGGTITEGNA